MLDFFFKAYYVFFRKKLEQGASAAVILLSIPLGVNIYLLFLILISFFIHLRDFGGPAFGLLAAVIVFVTGIALRYKYVVKGRYASISAIKYPIIYAMIGVIYYIVSLIVFAAITVAFITG